MMTKTMGIALTLAMMAMPSIAHAQDHSGHDMSAMKQAPAADDAARAYMDGMETMNRNMNAPMTGDADTDFATMMIPHHQGAIDMAKVQLEYGKDPQLRKLSEDIVKAQESEIAVMKGWLAKH